MDFRTFIYISIEENGSERKLPSVRDLSRDVAMMFLEWERAKNEDATLAHFFLENYSSHPFLLFTPQMGDSIITRAGMELSQKYPNLTFLFHLKPFDTGAMEERRWFLDGKMTYTQHMKRMWAVRELCT